MTRGVVITVFRQFTDLKKKNNIGEALLHANYFSKPSDTETKYTELELNTSLSSNCHKACIYTLNVRSLSKIICRYFVS